MTPIPPMQSVGESSQFHSKTHRLRPVPTSPSKRVLPRVRIFSQPFTSISKINVTVRLLLVNTIKTLQTASPFHSVNSHSQPAWGEERKEEKELSRGKMFGFVIAELVLCRSIFPHSAGQHVPL